MARLSTLLLLALAAGAQADIAYTVTCQPEKNNLHISIRIPNTKSGATLQIPNWAPGSYRLVDNFKNVQNFTAKDGNGGTLTFTNETNSWKIAPAETTVVDYDVQSFPLDGAMHWSGPSTYMYVADRKTEACDLAVVAQSGWTAYVGLDKAKGGSANEFAAPDYDVLADNPVSIGNLTVDTYKSRGKDHFIVMRGKPRADVDREYLIKACKYVSDFQTRFFGGKAPYNHYVWHFNVSDNFDGAGGLEHLSSTQISLASGVGPRVVSVLSHEFFHLWNVKRIRSAVLGPFDYNQLPQTGALWWLEGTTDYFAHYLLYRYNWWGRDMFYKDILDNLNQVRNNPARLTVSPHDASYRVREAANGRGNSQGYQISYYPYGWIAGMILDLELRDRTDGKYCLDDVELRLWELCKDDKPGFPEDQIRTELVKLAGIGMGHFYDDVIMKPGEVIVEQQLAKVGLAIQEKDETYADDGFTGAPNVDAGGIVIQSVSEFAREQLKSQDVITKMGDVAFSGSRKNMQVAFNDVQAKLKAGQPIALSVKRGTELISVTITPAQATRKVKAIVEVENPSPKMIALRNGWLKQITPR